jgi:hypothetical protein
VVFVFGVAVTTATSEPSASISGFSDEESLVLDAATPALALDARATVNSDVPVITGEIGLNVSVNPDAVGSLAVGLRSLTSGAQQTLDIVDLQAQGLARIGIDAFEDCPTGRCVEELELTFERIDEALEGEVGLTFHLDGLADTETDPAEGELTFEIRR